VVRLQRDVSTIPLTVQAGCHTLLNYVSYLLTFFCFQDTSSDEMRFLQINPPPARFESVEKSRCCITKPFIGRGRQKA